MTKRILLIDGDQLAFRSSAAAESRTVEVFHKPSERSKIFKTRTAFKEYLSNKNFEFKPEDYEFKDIQTEEDVSHPMHSIKLQIERMMNDTNADTYRIYVGGQDNFRDFLPLPSKYKGQRANMLRPIHLEACKEYIVSRFNGSWINGHEVDDEQVIDGYYFLDKGYEVYLASMDKDSKAYSGMYFYDFTQPKPEGILIPEFGNLYLNEKNEVKGWGFLWFCQQWTNGDVTDNFKPSEIAKKKYGEKSAYKILVDCTTKQEAYNVVKQQYQQWYPDKVEYTSWDGQQQIADYKDLMQLYFRCARMKSTKDDQLILDEFLEKEKIKA